mmetsp:Transcript_6549/g.14377  ORF Transcript_6549/g.14377 Transcript_6549/m.14377 type:complete len:214 (+) Transcript_6549:3158-3799(+)
MRPSRRQGSMRLICPLFALLTRTRTKAKKMRMTPELDRGARGVGVVTKVMTTRMTKTKKWRRLEVVAPVQAAMPVSAKPFLRIPTCRLTSLSVTTPRSSRIGGMPVRSTLTSSTVSSRSASVIVTRRSSARISKIRSQSLLLRLRACRPIFVPPISLIPATSVSRRANRSLLSPRLSRGKLPPPFKRSGRLVPRSSTTLSSISTMPSTQFIPI